MRNFLFIALQVVPIVGILAQSTSLLDGKVIRLDSTKQDKVPAVIHANQVDSLWRVWQLEEKKQRTVARKEFLANFDQLPDTLEVLRMDKLDLTEMPDISRFNQLRELHAANNKLETIPKTAFTSDSLHFVDLSGNPLHRLKIPTKNTVVSIKMEACSLKRIPFSLRKMKHLKRIYLGNQGTARLYQGKNGIKRIPCFLKKMDSLTEINLNYNKVKLNKAAVRRLKNIKVILLAGNELEMLPENIDQLTEVKRLNFSKNHLSELPASFSELDSLKSVIFYENNFSIIPLEVCTLKNLKELDFYYNNINEIPDEITRLQKLERLYLSFNNIKVLPESLRSLKKLKRLYIHHNQLVIVPHWITEIVSLEVLDVGYNHIIDFPDVSEMPKLYEVDIQDNAIGEIPWKLANKENLKLLFLKNNLFLEDENSRSALRRLQKERGNECVIVID
ncbi:MAG: leucine-rich repeat domain-containing protein [Bacteroidales bacterium]|nr:leucine-rich repeat domain-containing protein [Bacteroidales bacterium]